ncbi:MAG: hypothetical protein A2Y38_17155 [Spirochaetes bacterium GWB1_59_5]|nr:MAG: hypothetical protein A2Y38_17155 [Spirochaetes bacterium GWB1_59_5]
MSKTKDTKQACAAPVLTDKPCPRCLDLAQRGRIRMETIQRLPAKPAPRGLNKRYCCFDCAAADGLMKLQKWSIDDQHFEMARIATGNCRQEQYRLCGAPMGLVGLGLMRPSAPGDLEEQHVWLDKNGWFGGCTGDDE